jgi:predicted RNA-binding Zn-ribbon protein involved in translation (DUF1610 family)
MSATMTCLDCGAQIERTNARQLRCPDCAKAKNQEDNRRAKAEQRKQAVAVGPSYANSPCRKCGNRKKYNCEKLVWTQAPLPCMPAWKETPVSVRMELRQQPAVMVMERTP